MMAVLLSTSTWVTANEATPTLPAPLAEASFYAWGQIGTPGALSEAERVAREIAATWSPAQILAALPTATAEGKLYLLCVMNRQHPRAYAQAKQLAQLSADQEVSVFAGTVLRKVRADQLIQQLERSRCEPLTWPVKK